MQQLEKTFSLQSWSEIFENQGFLVEFDPNETDNNHNRLGASQTNVWGSERNLPTCIWPSMQAYPLNYLQPQCRNKPMFILHSITYK
jgi:hypothetical protein